MAYIKDGKYCSDDYIKEENSEILIGKERYFADRHSKSKIIFMECGCHSEDALFNVDFCHEKHLQEFALDSVIVDTASLFGPLVKIDFSSLIFFDAEGKGVRNKEIEVELLFELERICDGKKEIVQSWKYTNKNKIGTKTQETESILQKENIQPWKCESKPATKSEVFAMEISEPFTVTSYDKSCSGCCEYKMIVKGKDFEGVFKALRVTKPVLSALIQGVYND